MTPIEPSVHTHGHASEDQSRVDDVAAPPRHFHREDRQAERTHTDTRSRETHPSLAGGVEAATRTHTRSGVIYATSSTRGHRAAPAAAVAD